MNVRFSEGSVRCRVKRAELTRLLEGRAVALEVGLPRDHAFRLSVRPSSLSQWQLESDPTGLWLTIPKSELQGLAESLPNREGLEHTFKLADGGDVVFSFEVDVKDRGGKKAIGDSG